MRRLAILVCLTLILSCGHAEPLGQVEGVVRFRKQPAGNLLVTFIPDSERGDMGGRASGITDAEGHYQLRTDRGKPGVSLGWYRIVVEDLDVGGTIRKKGEGDDDVGGTPARPSRVPRPVSNFSTTPHRHEVVPGAQRVDFDL